MPFCASPPLSSSSLPWGGLCPSDSCGHHVVACVFLVVISPKYVWKHGLLPPVFELHINGAVLWVFSFDLPLSLHDAVFVRLTQEEYSWIFPVLLLKIPLREYPEMDPVCGQPHQFRVGLFQAMPLAPLSSLGVPVPAPVPMPTSSSSSPSSVHPEALRS